MSKFSKSKVAEALEIFREEIRCVVREIIMRVALVSFLVAFTVGSSCPPPPAGACETEAALLSVVSAGVQASEDQFNGIDDPDVRQAIGASRASLEGGAALVSACENLRDGASWQEWVNDMLGHAVRLGTSIVAAVQNRPDIAGDGGADPRPGALVRAIDELRAEQERF